MKNVEVRKLTMVYRAPLFHPKKKGFDFSNHKPIIFYRKAQDNLKLVTLTSDLVLFVMRHFCSDFSYIIIYFSEFRRGN